MGFNNLKAILLLRVVLLTITIFYFAWNIIEDGSLIIQLIIFIVFAFQVITLIKFLESSHEELIKFFTSFKAEDMAFHYQPSDNKELARVQAAIQKIVRQIRNSEKSREAEFQYLKNIVQHAGVGLITFDDQENIHIMNLAARNLLKINKLQNVSELNAVGPQLTDIFRRLKTGGRDLIRLQFGEDVIQLAIYAIELSLNGEKFKLISLQNIHSELEEKEMEAWQNLVRVLTHEIMNSVTPITSLASTIENDLYDQLNNAGVTPLSPDDIADLHLAVKTIKKRGHGLNKFVQDFRNLAHVPEPFKREVNVKEIFDEILILMQYDITEKGIQVSSKLSNNNFIISADKELVEQVLINIIKNAIQVFDEQTHKLIELSAYYEDENHPVISIKDNGPGIEPEAIEKIFIPFFTTKKTGSGIGLSLSRQIMRKHGGSLMVKSNIDEGTAFFLKF